MIWEKLDEAIIMQDLDVESCNDVFDQLGGRLVETGYCKDSYVEALKIREKDYPTGVEMGEVRFAMPHTDRCHVNKMAIAIGVPKKPVPWIHMGTTDQQMEADLVLMLAITNPDSQIDTLQRAIALFQDDTLIGKIRSAKDQKKIIEIFKEEEANLQEE